MPPSILNMLYLEIAMDAMSMGLPPPPPAFVGMAAMAYMMSLTDTTSIRTVDSDDEDEPASDDKVTPQAMADKLVAQTGHAREIYEKNRDSRAKSIKPELQRRDMLLLAEQLGNIKRPEPMGHYDAGLMQLWTGDPTYCSVKMLEQLSVVNFGDLFCPKRHEGSLLICRILTECVSGSGFTFQMEDPNGDAMPLTIMNVTPKLPAHTWLRLRQELYPVGAILAIKEPNIKYGIAGGIVIRVDVPKDITILHPKHPLIKRVQWKFESAGGDIPSASQEKERGNNAMEAREFTLAIRHYTSALDDPTADLSPFDRVVLLLNRAQAHNDHANHGSAFRDCLEVENIAKLNGASCMTESQQRKLAWRSAYATYHMRLYDQAAIYLKRAQELGVKQADVLLNKLDEREVEATRGDYKWAKLYAAQNDSTAPDLDVADYIGPIAITDIEGKGRGIVASRDLQAGDLLVVSKALVCAYPSEAHRLQVLSHNNFLGPPGSSGSTDSATHVMAVSKAVHSLTDNIGLGPVWDGLFPTIKLAKTDQPLPHPITNPAQRLVDIHTDYMIDPLRIEGILTANAFGTTPISKVANQPPPINPLTKKVDSGTALWGLPSLFNHSCVPSATLIPFGDVAVVRALHHIPRGEEITLSYFPGDLPYTERKERADKFEFVCKCPLCVSDAANFHLSVQRESMLENVFPRLMNASRKAIQMARSLQVPPSVKLAQKKPLEDMRNLLKRMDDTYGPGREKGLKHDSHRIYRAIADHLSILDPLESIKTEIVGLELMGMVMANKKQRARHGRTIQRFGQIGGDSRVICPLLIAMGYEKALRNAKEAAAWVKTAYWVDEIIMGTGQDVFRKRYAEHLHGLGRFALK